MSDAARGKTRFLINKAGVYYLTTGRLLIYDPAEAKKGSPHEKGVEEVKKKFEEIEKSPHTWYPAVEISDASFGPMNTGQSELT